MVMSREAIYNKMCRVLARHNGKDTEFINIVRMPKDQIRRRYAENPVLMEFGGMMIPVPDNVEEYLRHHYPNLRPVLPVEEQINHAPYKLVFDTRDEK
jgi:phosphorylcholine metabolism protein LicD